MILLILIKSFLVAWQLLHLNSIMILLIPIAWSLTCRSHSFKFHYDSINSSKDERYYVLFVTFKFHYDSINSYMKQMFMGIRSNLNSIMILLILFLNGFKKCIQNEFKFHYDSINSKSRSENKRGVKNLNSIMILLIQLRCLYILLIVSLI